MTRIASGVAGAEDRIARAGLIAIFRSGHAPDDLLALAEAVTRGGIGVLEVTLNSASALEGIRRLRDALPADVLVGAGTVRDAADVDAAVEAGAEFLVAPNLSEPALERAAARERLLLPGVLTPSEAQRAFAAGCRMVKLFPAEPLGPGYLGAIRAPLADVGFVPTGGIRPENVEAYLAAGAMALGIGSSLVRDVPVNDGELRRVETVARDFAERLAQARAGRQR